MGNADPRSLALRPELPTFVAVSADGTARTDGGPAAASFDLPILYVAIAEEAVAFGTLARGPLVAARFAAGPLSVAPGDRLSIGEMAFQVLLLPLAVRSAAELLTVR